MTKKDIAQMITSQTGITPKQATQAIDTTLIAIAEAVESGDIVTLRGFGTFKQARRKAKLARNLKTLEPLQVPARTIPVFVPSDEFSQRVQTAAQIGEHLTQQPV